jgi:hypothetical protein
LKQARERACAALAKVAEGDDPASEKQAVRRGSRVPDAHDLIAKIVPPFGARFAARNQCEATAYETAQVLNWEIVSSCPFKHKTDSKQDSRCVAKITHV